MSRPWILSFLLLALPALTPAADAQIQPQAYAAAYQVDLVRLLPPPPGAAETRRELAAMLLLQEHRSAAEAAACKADQVISVFRFADVLGAGFRPGKLPRTAAFFDRVLATARIPSDQAKKFWDRPRPPVADGRIQPCVDLPSNASYPSGHSTAGNLMATVLAGMVPEKAAALYARGRLFGDRRVLGGVHYPSDVDAGRLCATALAQALYEDARFRKDLAGARVELRAALGWKP